MRTMSLVAVVVTAISFVTLGASDVLSHSGGTDAAGCHYEYVDGVPVGYHCH